MFLSCTRTGKGLGTTLGVLVVGAGLLLATAAIRSSGPSLPHSSRTPPAIARTDHPAGASIVNPLGTPEAVILGEPEPIAPDAERGHYLRFLRLVRGNVGAFELEGSGLLLDPERSTCEKVAFLRAADEGRAPSALKHFHAVLAGHEPLPSFAVRFLCRRAEADPAARSFLAVEVMAQESLNPFLRRDAAQAVFRWAAAGELDRLLPQFLRVGPLEVARGALLGLLQNGGPEATRLLSWLSQGHPDPEVRQLAESLTDHQGGGEVTREE
jgi:hypothetical protein